MKTQNLLKCLLLSPILLVWVACNAKIEGSGRYETQVNGQTVSSGQAEGQITIKADDPNNPNPNPNQPIASNTATNPSGTTTSTQPSTTPSGQLKARIDCPVAISDDEVENLKSQIRKDKDAFMSEDKLELIKQLVNERCLRAAHVRDLMALIQMNDDQLEFAKFGYGRTVDKAAFEGIIVPALSFSQDKEALRAFLREQAPAPSPAPNKPM